MASASKRTRPRGERGASAVEYALLVAGIAAVIVAIVFVVGRYTGAAYSTTCANLETGYATPGLTC